ncbi:hypothetical protein GGI00_001991 [Coemansia sp. RSA 2681]|nr:hypothetical protein GGI00_001991 [Coemansia sp. RSA 2681]
MALLGLRDKFNAYTDRATGAFNQCAQDLGVIIADGAKKTAIVEGVFASGFQTMMTKLIAASKATLAPEYSESLYVLVDGQSHNLLPTTRRPDFIFFARKGNTRSFGTAHLLIEAKKYMSSSYAYNTFLGQLADYALNIRAHQPMRKFVPVLFLYGCQLDLVVFTHGGYYATPVGPVLHMNDADKSQSCDSVSESLQQLWFVLTLSPVDFGNILPTLGTPWSLYIDDSPRVITTRPATEDSDTVTTARVAVSGEPSSPESRQLTDLARIDREVHITGRCTYLFTAKHQGRDVVLKLNWIRTSKLPEGAIYEVLRASGVQNTPAIISSGVIVGDTGGYRLELLLMEHCGESFVGYVVRVRDDTPAPEVRDLVKGCVMDVTQTLAQALGASILHRDISSGNLAIKAGKVRVIDWGCAKIMQRPPDTLADELSRRWGIDWNTVIGTGSDSDPFTGTPLYMSIQMLLKTRRRNIFNDIESLFYVVLDALSDRTRHAEPRNAPGFVYHGSLSTALMRLGCLCSIEHFWARFGVNAGNAFVPKDVLDAMHQFLFFERGIFIGDKLQYLDGCERVFDDEAAKKFMEDDTRVALGKDYRTQQRAPTPTKDQADDGLPEAIHDAMPMAAIAESRLPPPHLDLGGLSLDRGDSGMDPADPLVPGLDIIPELSAPATSPAASKTRIVKRPRVKRPHGNQPPPQASGRVLRSMTAGRSVPPAPNDSLNTNTPSTATGASKRSRIETPDDATGQPARNKENKQPRK